MDKLFEFRRVRDFGTVLNHGFEFIKHEYKRLGQALLFYVLPVFILTGIAMVFVQRSFTQDIFSSPQQQAVNATFNNLKITGLNYFLQLINQTVLTTVVYLFIKLYKDNNGAFAIDKIPSLILKYIFKILIASLVCTIITVLAMMFFIIPGLYLGVVFSLVFPLIIIEDLSFGKAMSRSFDLIKERWWVTFGVIFIGLIIMYIFSMLISVPLMLVAGFNAFHALSNNTPNELFSTSYLIVNAISTVIQNAMYLVPLVFVALQYFSLVEEKERPTLQDKIDQMLVENE